ncbi:MAG: OB-fold domain-containing protein, partial [SAR202 cluster bacterium]|nr:OB-fold domain-containing protein [SAR202 cluster bacterium]
YSYTIIHAPPAGWKGLVPYVLGSVKLPEGPQVLSEVIDLDPETIEIDMPMTMVLRAGEADDEGREITLYKWQAMGA